MSRSEVRAAAGVSVLCVLAYSSVLVTAALFPGFSARVMSGELGLIESAQAAVLSAALICAVAAVREPAAAESPGLRFWLALLAVGLFYVLGEEISWGQHYFGWETPGWFARNNDQGETNLHNTSSWLDQKPRALLVAAVVAGGLVNPLIKALRGGRGLLDRPWWLAPPLACAPPAFFAWVGALPKRLNNMGLGDLPFHYRASEVEELFFYVFGLIYVAALLLRLRAGARRPARLSAATATAEGSSPRSPAGTSPAADKG